MAKPHILSLDGGGTWALVQARILGDIYGENTPGHDILKNFNMAIGNSGGGLVLTSLCANKSPKEIYQILTTKELRNKAFVPLPFWKRLINNLPILKEIKPRYDAAAKLKGLKELLGQPWNDILLTDIPDKIGKPDLKIILIGYDYTRRRVKLFRSQKDSKSDFTGNLDGYDNVLLVEAAHATSNAPVKYFDEAAKVHVGYRNKTNKGNQELFWDGAISGFNNPVLAGLIEYLVNYPDTNKDELAILSIGTSTTILPTLTEQGVIDLQNKENLFKSPQKEPSGFIHDISKLSTSILSDPPDSATYMAQVMLHHNLQKAINNNTNLIRINPLISPVKDAVSDGFLSRYDYPMCYRNLSGIKKFDALIKMDMDATKDEEVALIKEFTEYFLTNQIDNQLVRGNIYDGRGIIGYVNYKSAKQAWLNLQ